MKRLQHISKLYFSPRANKQTYPQGFANIMAIVSNHLW